MDVPEIQRGKFVYRDTLFVDLGPNKRHPRTSQSDLKDLLLPKSGGVTTKDQVAHWYEAQLIHYGLQRSKDKNTAKVRLTNAIASKALSVPPHIQQMEVDMKKEFASATRKAKTAASKKKEPTSADHGAAKGKKRKADEDGPGSKTTVSVKVGDVTLEIGHLIEAAGGTGAKKQKMGPSEPKASVPRRQAAPKTASKQTAKATSSTPKSATVVKSAAKSTATKATSTTQKSAAVVRSSAKSTAATSAARTGNYARRGRPFPRSPRTRPLQQAPPQIDDCTPASFDSDDDMEDSPPPYDSINFEEDQYESHPTEGTVQISGSYEIHTSDDYPAGFTLKIDKREQKLWGRFNIGCKAGIIRMETLEGLCNGSKVPFGWRSEDEESGSLRFDRGCVGTMQFDGEGQVEGYFRGLMDGEDIEFSGDLINEDDLDVDEMQFHWNEFPRRAYGRP